jgi:hypothetical protein
MDGKPISESNEEREKDPEEVKAKHAANATAYDAGADLRATDFDEETSFARELRAHGRRYYRPKEFPNEKSPES